MKFYVYILQSLKDNSFYTGYSSNLLNRVREHNFGSTRYTSHKRPWELIYSEEFDNKRDALKRLLNKLYNINYILQNTIYL